MNSPGALCTSVEPAAAGFQGHTHETAPSRLSGMPVNEADLLREHGLALSWHVCVYVQHGTGWPDEFSRGPSWKAVGPQT